MLDPYWLLLLLPAAAASGWYAGRRDLNKNARKNSEEFNLSSAYFRGLNFLLNEQPDKAIEVFIKVLEVDSETVDLHLTLGSLFRRRGEIERATRIHQNLIARPNLNKSQRLQALSELARDYFKAGLFDRAENLCQELADVPTHAEQALTYLIQIYEQEKEWLQAIDAQQRLARYASRDVKPVIAHYYCELAEVELERNNTARARDYIGRALQQDKNCTRATIQSGEVAYRKGDFRRAIDTWRQIEHQDPRYLGEVIEKLVDSFNQLGDDQGLSSFLRHASESYDLPAVLQARVAEIVRRDGAAAAVEFLNDWLRENPSVEGLKRLMELKQADGENTGMLDNMQVVLAGMIENEHGYRCRQCGFSGRAMHWQCPGCKGWQTYEPGPKGQDHPVN